MFDLTTVETKHLNCLAKLFIFLRWEERWEILVLLNQILFRSSKIILTTGQAFFIILIWFRSLIWSDLITVGVSLFILLQEVKHKIKRSYFWVLFIQILLFLLSFLTLIIYWLKGVGTRSRIQIKRYISKPDSNLLPRSFYYFILLKLG